MANVPQILGELARRLTEMHDTYVAINSAQAKTPMEQFMLGKIDQWTRGTGSTLGHLAEFEKYHKHRVKKHRVIASAKNTGDVVIGQPGDPYAKTIQSKAITSDAHNAVDTHITKAVEQIAGLYHETPRPGDHLVVSIVIFNDGNTWPFTPNEVSNNIPALSEFRNRLNVAVKNAVEQVMRSQASNATNSLWTNLNRAPYSSPVAPSLKSPVQRSIATRNVYDPVRGFVTKSEYQITPTFYTKFNWPFGYSLSDGGTLKLAKTVVVRYNSTTKAMEIAREEFFS